MSLSVSDHRPSTALTGALRVLLVAALLTAVWLGLNVMYPGFSPSGIPMAVTRIVVHGLILAGLWAGLSRTALSFNARLATWLAIAVPFTLWLAAIWILAAEGAFQPGVLRLPILPLAILLPLLVVLPILLRSRRIAEVLDAVPPSWLIGLQFYRVFGGIFFLGWAAGITPGVFALPAGTGDVLTGLLALPVAFYVHAAGRGARRRAIAWNLLGIVDLIVAITTGALSSPGPLQMLAFDHPNLAVGTYPTVLIPAFAVPMSLLFHGLSLRQLRRLGRNEASSHSPALREVRA
jgi:hypothetical protein